MQIRAAPHTPIRMKKVNVGIAMSISVYEFRCPVMYFVGRGGDRGPVYSSAQETNSASKNKKHR